MIHLEGGGRVGKIDETPASMFDYFANPFQHAIQTQQHGHVRHQNIFLSAK